MKNEEEERKRIHDAKVEKQKIKTLSRQTYIAKHHGNADRIDDERNDIDKRSNSDESDISKDDADNSYVGRGSDVHKSDIHKRDNGKSDIKNSDNNELCHVNESDINEISKERIAANKNNAEISEYAKPKNEDHFTVENKYPQNKSPQNIKNSFELPSIAIQNYNVTRNKNIAHENTQSHSYQQDSLTLPKIDDFQVSHIKPMMNGRETHSKKTRQKNKNLPNIHTKNESDEIDIAIDYKTLFTRKDLAGKNTRKSIPFEKRKDVDYYYQAKDDDGQHELQQIILKVNSAPNRCK